MNVAFWAARWSEGKIGFHEGRVNHYLEAHAARFGERRRILVPLCGKSEDLAFLASRGHTVVGIEAVETAVTAFFEEHGLVPEVTERERVKSFSANGITLLCGDVFDCSAADVGPVDAFYDRAALVALPPDVRPRYVTHLRDLLGVWSKGLLVTFEYPQDKAEPPPWSVTEAEVRSLYAGASVALLEGGAARGGRLSTLGIGAEEKCFALEL